MNRKTPAVILASLLLVALVFLIAFDFNEQPPVALNIVEQDLSSNMQSTHKDNARSSELLIEDTQDGSLSTLQKVNSEEQHQLKPEDNDIQTKDQVKPSLDSFDELITEADGKLYMDSAPIDSMDREQLSWFISSLPNTMTQARSVDVMENLNQEIVNYATEADGIFINDMQCSDMICGVMFESRDKSSVKTALSELSSSDSFNNNTHGGVLRILEENGTFYGVIVTPITESNILIR
ncbi:hypothetical protein [Pseudoalteromonas sp. T1lg76]|uniref:hypothetical protein n=1 Tax=Pseudoalteromonas sp. T1lg76 TaxID=2077103 RepID=UPI000CF6DD2A|nr:hypothetical protein [Pseudoalteromonas sp. T1lg76]